MNLKGDKFVRFQDWSSENSYNSERQFSMDNGFYARKAKLFFNGALAFVQRGWEFGSERIKSLRKRLTMASGGSKVSNTLSPKRMILDPQDSFLQTWNKIFVLVCVFAVAVDPLFLYIPVVEHDKMCLDLDKKLGITASVLRTIIDVVYILRIVFQFRTGFIAPSSRVFGRGVLVDDPSTIARKYLTSFFIIDFLAILPLPQVVVLTIIPSLSGPVSLHAKNILKFVILCQYVPRLMRICPLYKEVTRTSGILAETAWLGAAYNLLLYMLASHVIGAFWYLFSIEREDKCWHEACHKHEGCNSTLLYCRDGHNNSNIFPIDSCPFIRPDDIKDQKTFNFGIFIDALDSHVVESKDFPKKLFYCFWWGLRNLSSLGQNLQTSTYVPEILSAVAISIAGLVLFSLLIGNMQVGLYF